MVAAPAMVITAKASPANTLTELIELGKRKEGGLTFASAGTGSPSHLSALAHPLLHGSEQDRPCLLLLGFSLDKDAFPAVVWPPRLPLRPRRRSCGT